MRLCTAALLLAAAGAAIAIEPAAPAPFSASAPGDALPGGWKERRIARAAPAQVTLVADARDTVLQVRSRAAAGGAAHALRIDVRERPMLAWRWKVDRVVEKGALGRAEGDDFAARLYVFFDIPAANLPLATRVKMGVARLLYGEELPTAGICYVWDSHAPVEASAWNPYTDRVRMVVAQSGGRNAGSWADGRRDLEADFRAAFGAEWSGPVPAVVGVAVSSDTDQTGEAVTARFGDLRFEARP